MNSLYDTLVEVAEKITNWTFDNEDKDEEDVRRRNILLSGTRIIVICSFGDIITLLISYFGKVHWKPNLNTFGDTQSI